MWTIDGDFIFCTCGARYRYRGYPIRGHECEASACRHLAERTGPTIAVACTCGKGQKSIATHAIHACAKHGECLPSFQCTAANKSAVREEWIRSDGGDVNVMTCRDCRAEGLGFDATAKTLEP